MTHEVIEADLRAGGGWRRLTHLYPNDTWMLRPEVRTEELNEQTDDKLNPYLMIGDEIIVVDVNKADSGRGSGASDDGGLRMTPTLFQT